MTWAEFDLSDPRDDAAAKPSKPGKAHTKDAKPSGAGRRPAKPSLKNVEIVPFTIYWDSNEGLPWTFDSMTQGRKALIVPTEKHNILWGDYTIREYQTIAIERKSLSDLYGTLTHGRKRFTAEIEALNEQPYEYAAVVVEASWVEIADPTKQDPCWISRASPESIIGTIVAWSRHYPNVRWFAAGSRREAEVLAFQKMREFWTEKQKEIK